MNLFNLIGQYNKNMGSTYGDILDNNLNPENKLSKTEKEIYNKYKLGDIQRFKLNENNNLVDHGSKINRQPQEISGIGMVTQIC